MLQGMLRTGGDMRGKDDGTPAAALCRIGAAGGLSLLLAWPAPALESVSFDLTGADKQLERTLLAASLLADSEAEEIEDPLDLIATARADYGRLLAALYSEGYYGGTISILIDGREAADIDPATVPVDVGRILVRVDPGPKFRFSAARMRPYAPGTDLPPAYRDGLPAYSTAIRDAAQAGVAGWRALGHAKAEVSGQEIVADHAGRSVDSLILLDSGPKLTFGELHLSGPQRMRAQRILKIAGYRKGETFDPELLDRMASRLRQTGIFRAVTVREAETANADGTLDIHVDVVEEALRRFGFGAEYSSADGAQLSAFWLHRNLFGGGERLRFDATLDSLGDDDEPAEYTLGLRMDRPGTPFTDSSVFAELTYDDEEILDAEIRTLSIGIGATRVVTERLTADLGLSYEAATVDDPLGRDTFRVLALPFGVTFDSRDDARNPSGGLFLEAGATPFMGFDGTDSGTSLHAEARAYRSLDRDGGIILSGRARIGTTLGTSILTTAPQFLFYSGGADTVRGHPYQSLGVTVSGTDVGGLSFAGLTAEVRAIVSERIGGVVFLDAGYVSDEAWLGGTGEWQTGAGIGVRYDTGLGPVRLDVAYPVSGSTADGLQFYVGFGQAF
jgi:translocation and assembly module TamA